MGALIGAVLFAELLLGVGIIGSGSTTIAGLDMHGAQVMAVDNTRAIGRVLYTQYFYLFQVAGLVLLVAMIVAGTVTLLRSARQPVVVRQEAILSAGNPDRIRISVDAAATKNARAVDICENEINSLLDRHFAEIQAAGHKAAVDVSSYDSCRRIIYRLAKDSVRGTSSAASYVDREMTIGIEPALRACAADLEAALGRFDLALQKSTAGLASDLALSQSSSKWQEIAVAVDLEAGQDLDTTLRNLGFQGVGIAVSGGFDAWAVMNSTLMKKLLEKAVALAGRVFARPAATAVASVTAAAVDGPLPIGDIFAVAGIAYTAYDISATRHEFRTDLKASVDNALPQMKRSVHGQVMDRVHAILDAHQNAQDEIRNQSLSHIGR